MEQKKRRIESILSDYFSPVFLCVEDESHLHAGHASAPKSGQSHFRVTIVSEAFENDSRAGRHRRVYQSLGDMMQEIHALALHIYSPAEYGAKQQRVAADH